MAQAIHPIAELVPQHVLHIGTTADWVATPAGSIWVGSAGPNAVTHIDPNTAAITDVVALPGEPCAGLVVAGGYLWVPLCSDPSRLARVDLRTRRLDRVFPIGPAAPEGGGAGSDRSVWLVTDTHGSLVRIDAATGAVRAKTEIAPGAFNLRYVDGVLFATKVVASTLIAIDPASGAVLGESPTGLHPRFLTFGAGCVWTLNQGDGSVSGIEVAVRQRRFQLAVHPPGAGGDIAFGGGKVWTTVRGIPLSVIDPVTGLVQRQWSGEGGDSLGVSSEAIWLTDFGLGTITKYALSDILASLDK
jgi:virginiamycin B lyase